MFGGQIQAVCFPTTPHFKLGYKLQHCSQWSKRSQPGAVFNAADSKATQQTSFDISHVCQNRDESKRTDKMRGTPQSQALGLNRQTSQTQVSVSEASSSTLRRKE